MKFFKVRVTEKIEKIVEIKAESFDDAVSIVREKYSNGEIAPTSSDMQTATFEAKAAQEEYQSLIGDLIAYCYDNEERHYEEFEDEKPADHIFLKIKELKTLHDFYTQVL